MIRGRTREVYWILVNFGKELLKIDGNALDLTGFGEQAHDMAIPKQKLVAHTILGEGNVVRGDRIVELVEGLVPVPRMAQGVPLRFRTHSTHMECALQDDESIRIRKNLLQGSRKR
jgi:hypothetical protein